MYLPRGFSAATSSAIAKCSDDSLRAIEGRRELFILSITFCALLCYQKDQCTALPPRSRWGPFGDDHPQSIGMPELSVSFATDRGEILLVGCSHSTIETIVQETRKIRQGKILLVAGGFHLVSYDRAYIEALAQRMRDEYGVDSVAPAHCTGHLAFAIFRNEFGERFRFFGLGTSLRL